MSKVEWGTAEYFEQCGENRIIKKIIKSLKERGMSEEEIHSELEKMGISLDDFSS